MERAAASSQRNSDRQVAYAQKAADRALAMSQRAGDRLAAYEAKNRDRIAAGDQRAVERRQQLADQAATRLTALAQRQADRTTAINERAADRTRSIGERAADRTAAISQKAADRIAAYEAKNKDRIAAGDQRAIARRDAMMDRALERATRRAERDADAQARAANRSVKSLTDQEIANRVVNAKMTAANEKRVAAAMRAAGVEYKGMNKSILTAGNLIGAVKGIAGAFGIAVSASAGISFVAAEFDKITRSAIEGVRFTDEYRKSLLELAALKGHLGNAGQETRESLAFRAKTLQSLEQSTAFQSAALGVGQSNVDDDRVGRKGLISEDEFRKSMEFGGAFQAAEGGSAETHGQLVGQIPMLLGRRTNAKEVSAVQSKLYDIFQPGGASFSSMVGGYLKNAPLVTSGVISAERLAAVESAMSVSDPGGHADKTQQFVRATAGGIGKMKGPKVEGEDLEKIGPYLKRLGVTEKMDPIEIGKKISADLSVQEKAGRNLKTYLAEKGYGSQEEANALLGFHGMQKSGQFKTFEDLAAAPASSGKLQTDVRAFQTAEPIAQARKADIATEAGSLYEGMGKEDYYQSIMRNTFNKMKTEGATDQFGFKFSGKWEDIAGAGWYDINAKMTQDMVYQEARKGLNLEYGKTAKGKASGMSQAQIDGMGPDAMKSIIGRGAEADFLYEQRSRVGEAGGNIMPGFEQMMGKMDSHTEAVNRNTEAIKKGQAAEAKPPLPVGVNLFQSGMLRW